MIEEEKMDDTDPGIDGVSNPRESCPTVGHDSGEPPGLRVLLDEEAAFQAEEARRRDELPEARFRRWGEEMHRGSAQCVVRLRAYGEARAIQGEINEGVRSGQKMPILVWDERNGWKRSHAHNATKVYRAWVKTESYPVSWAGLTVREILARLAEPRARKSRPTVNRVLTSWTRAAEPKDMDIPEEVLRDTQPRVVTFTRRALEAFGGLGVDEVLGLQEALRAVLNEVEIEQPDQQTTVTRYARPSDVPEGLVFLSSTKARNPDRERMRRDPEQWEVLPGVEPAGLYRGTTVLYRVEDLVDLDGPADPQP